MAVLSVLADGIFDTSGLSNIRYVTDISLCRGGAREKMLGAAAAEVPTESEAYEFQRTKPTLKN